MAGFIRLENYSLHRVSGSDSIFVSRSHIIKVTSLGAEAVLRELDSDGRKLIPLAEFQNLCDKNRVDSQSVIETFGCAVIEVELKTGIGKIEIFSDDTLISDAVGELRSEYELGNDNVSSRTLTVAFFDTYDSMKFRMLYRQGSEQDLFVTCHLHDQKFIIDGMYRKDAKLPCHFCHRESFTSRFIQRYGATEDKWSSLMNNIGLYDQLSEPSGYRLSVAARHMISSAIYYRLKNLLHGGHHNLYFRPGLWTSYCLQTGEISSGFVPHHPQCGCITGDW